LLDLFRVRLVDVDFDGHVVGLQHGSAMSVLRSEGAGGTAVMWFGLAFTGEVERRLLSAKEPERHGI
jgi:hypothetical protein